ncbi:MAG: O-antigen ligase family protein [Cyanobacteria bacterium P01_G01_bin.39]
MRFTKLKDVSNWTWSYFSFSILIFPLFPALGAVGFVIILLTIWRDNYRKIVKNSLNQGFAVLAILLVISTALAEYPSEAWLGLANLLPFFALFIALRYLITTSTQLKQLSWLLILPSLPIVVLGLGQIYASWDTPAVVKSILGWELIPQGVPLGRMSSVFIYTNFLAIYLAIAFTLTFGLLLSTWKSGQSLATRQSAKIFILLLVILLADVSGLVMTSSRNAWGIAVLSFMAYAIYLGWRWLVWAVCGGATAIFWASFAPNLGGTQLRQVVPSFIWQRLSDQLYERPVETLRITQWQFCWDLIQSRPWFGWGLRNFTPLYEAKMNFWFGHPHNFWLMLGAETGLVTSLLFTGLIALVMYQAVNSLLNCDHSDHQLIFFSYAIATGCIICFNLADVTIFDLRINTIAWILLGAISGVTTSNKSNTK